MKKYIVASLLSITMAQSAYSMNVDKLVCAIENKNIDEVKQLVQNDTSLVNSQHHSLPVVSLAILHGAGDIVAYLFDQGADVNACDENGTSPLLIATGTKNIALVKLVLAQKPDLNKPDKILNETPFDVAISSGNSDIANLLQEAGAIALHGDDVGYDDEV